MFFKGGLGLLDPIYRCRLEAGGLEVQIDEFDFARSCHPPCAKSIHQNQNNVLDVDALKLWSDLYGNFADAFTVLGLAGEPTASPPVSPGVESPEPEPLGLA